MEYLQVDRDSVNEELVKSVHDKFVKTRLTRAAKTNYGSCVCNLCGKKFATPWTLKEHSRVHTG